MHLGARSVHQTLRAAAAAAAAAAARLAHGTCSTPTGGDGGAALGHDEGRADVQRSLQLRRCSLLSQAPSLPPPPRTAPDRCTRCERRGRLGQHPLRALSLFPYLAQLRRRRTELLRHRHGARQHHPASSRLLAGTRRSRHYVRAWCPPLQRVFLAVSSGSTNLARPPSLRVFLATPARLYCLAWCLWRPHCRPTARRVRWGGPW